MIVILLYKNSIFVLFSFIEYEDEDEHEYE